LWFKQYVEDPYLTNEDYYKSLESPWLTDQEKSRIEFQKWKQEHRRKSKKEVNSPYYGK